MGDVSRENTAFVIVKTFSFVEVEKILCGVLVHKALINFVTGVLINRIQKLQIFIYFLSWNYISTKYTKSPVQKKYTH